MKTLYVLGGIVLFALVTAVLYIWGLRKSVNQQQDMERRLRNKCAGIVVKQLKKSGVLTEQQIAALLSGVRSGEFWSRQKAVVGKPQEFVRELLPFMVDQRLIEQTDAGYRLK